MYGTGPSELTLRIKIVILIAQHSCKVYEFIEVLIDIMHFLIDAICILLILFECLPYLAFFAS
jgi:hypothetical protein